MLLILDHLSIFLFLIVIVMLVFVTKLDSLLILRDIEDMNSTLVR